MHRDRCTSDGRRWGVQSICEVLQFAPSTYYKATTASPSTSAVRDAVMIPILTALWVTNRKVYGAVKLWHAAHRAGHDIGRDQVARLMRELGIQGVRRAKVVRTTLPAGRS